MLVRCPLTPRITIATLFFAGAAIAAPATAPAAATPAAGPAKWSATLDSLVAAESRVRWERTLPDSALTAAARAGRPVFLDFYATWCMPCRWMDRAVYNDPLLGEIAEGVAMVRVDVDRPEGRRLADRYDVHLYPTVVYVAPDGREMLRWSGPLSLRDTRLNLGQIASPSSGRAALEAERARKPDDPATQAKALLWYGGRGEVERVRAIVDTLARGARGRVPANAALLQLHLARAEEVAGRRERALAAYRRALELEPGGALAWRAWLGVSAALDQAGDRAGAEQAAREAFRLRPERWLEARAARLALAATGPPLAPPPGVEAP